MKRVIWHSKALAVISSFPEDARRDLGYLIYRLQMGEQLTLPSSRSMKQVGNGVKELRVKDEAGIYRAFYLVKSSEGILIFHDFQKKTQKTPKHEIDIGKKRLKELQDE